MRTFSRIVGATLAAGAAVTLFWFGAAWPPHTASPAPAMALVRIASLPVTATSTVTFTVLLQASGDLNADGAVGPADLNLLADSYLLNSGDPGWNAEFDVNEDGKIDLLDFHAVARRVGTQ